MPFAVETFQYPDGAKTAQEKGITLYKGDGHILFTDCAAPHDITVRSRVGGNYFCFAVKGKQGYLSLTLPDAYAIETLDHPVQITIRIDGKDLPPIDAPKNENTPFGEGKRLGRATLLELRVTS
ncbi:hypothetical protein [Streptomyces sp. URMC 124]|uniref:hypothetical protein n=1 Tax=Streptomyces sp. URMC 124 TaxID=3423405 RepID=UPI003F198C74